LAKHPANQQAGVAGEAGAAAGEQGGTVMAVGSIRSRQDAVRALDAAAEFFRRNEPSSPVPLFVERAKRLVSKDFLEVLADVAPAGLDEAKKAGGVREETQSSE
jgi:type VI secretion system protein ImpA